MNHHLHPLLRRLGCATLLALAGVACAGTPSAALAPAAAPSSASTPEADSAALWRQMQTELADNGCDGPQQCHTVAVGSKACGGPESYRAWSSRHSDGSRLKQLAEQYGAARRAEDARAGMMSTCVFVADPGATCRAGHCELRPQGLGGGKLQQ